MSSQKKNHLRRALRAIALLVALLAAGVLGYQLLDYQKGKTTYARLRTQYTTQVSKAANDGQADLVVDFEALLAQNQDVVGWIDFDALDISYPIAKGSTNDTYLRHLLDGSYNSGGTLFMETANTGWNDLHVIVYGHNMRNGTMFGSLAKYTDPDFYEQNGGWFTLYTPNDGNWRYQIFGIKQVPATDPLYTVGFTLGEDYTAFLKQLCQGRLYQPPVAVHSNDQVLTLSTCTDDGKDRVVVLARRDHALEQ